MAKKDKQDKKDKKDKKSKKGESGISANSVAGMPGVAASVARTRSKAALVGMMFGALVAWSASGSIWWTIFWAIATGFAASMISWWLTVILWRMALPAEIKARQREYAEATLAASPDLEV